MPKLPVGSAFWTLMPDLATGSRGMDLLREAHIILHFPMT